MPFPIRAIEVDGGSEFEAIFEEECHLIDKAGGLYTLGEAKNRQLLLKEVIG